MATRSRRPSSRPGICAHRRRPCSRYRQRLEAKHLRQRRNGQRTRDASDDRRDERAPSSGSERPGYAGREPQRQRRGDQIGRGEHIHRQQRHEAAKTGPGKVGEIDPPERAIAPEEDASEEERAGQERRKLGEENLQQLPLLRGVGHQEYRVEAEMLHIEVGGDRERPEQRERNCGGGAPMAGEPVLGDGHRRARQAEAQHRQAHHQRAEMRPAPDGEDAHDIDLQRDHRARAQADGEIKPESASV